MPLGQRKYELVGVEDLHRLLEAISQTLSEQNHDAPKLCHAQEVLVLVFVANDQPPEVLKPREEPLDLPPPLVATQLASILALFLLSVLTMWSDHLDTSLKESLVERV